MTERGIDEINGFKMVSEKDSYIWAFVSLKSDLEILRYLNEEFPKIIEQVRHQEIAILDAKILSENLKDLEKYSESLKKIQEVADKENMKNIYVSLNDKKETQKLVYAGVARTHSSYLIREMSLIYIVAMFENFLQKILSISFRKKPEILMTSKKSITYEELLKLNDIDVAKREIMEKEIMVVNEDIDDIKQYIEQKFSIDISKFVDWKEFKERFYRRNILIHNSGMPNKIYRLKTGYDGKNERLIISESYLNASIDLLEEMSLKISIVLRNKFA